MNFFKQTVTALRRRLRRPIVGLYCDRDRVVVTDLLNDRRLVNDTQTVIEGDLEHVEQQYSVIKWLRIQYPTRRRLIILFCTPWISNYSMEQKIQLYEYARKLRCEVFFFEFQTIAAVGANIGITDSRKKIVAFVTDSTIHMYVYFAGGIGYQLAPEPYSEDRLDEIVEHQIHMLKDTLPRSVPKQFDRPGFPKEELLTGWHQGYSQELFLIFLRSPIDLPLSISGHWVVGVEDGVSCALKGLERMLCELCCTKDGPLFLRLLRYSYLDT